MEDQTQTRVREVVRDFLGAAMAPGGELTADTKLLEGGLLDSLGILQLTARIEEVFGIQVADEDFVPGNFETVGSLTRYVDARLAGG